MFCSAWFYVKFHFLPFMWNPLNHIWNFACNFMWIPFTYEISLFTSCEIFHMWNFTFLLLYIKSFLMWNFTCNYMWNFTCNQWRRQGGGKGGIPPQLFFAPSPFCPPPSSKKIIRHWERLKATQAFCRYRKMYGL